MKQPKIYFVVLLAITASQCRLAIGSEDGDDDFVMITLSQTQKNSPNPSHTEQLLTASVLAAHDAQNKTGKTDGNSQSKTSYSSSVSSRLHSEHGSQSDEVCSQKNKQRRRNSFTQLTAATLFAVHTPKPIASKADQSLDLHKDLTRSSSSSQLDLRSRIRAQPSLRPPTPIPGGERSPASPRPFATTTPPDTDKAADLRIAIGNPLQLKEPTRVIPNQPTPLGIAAQFDPAEATALASFNIHSQPQPRHRDHDIEAQSTESPLSSLDSLSYQNSKDIRTTVSNTANGKDSKSKSFFDCFKSCWARKKKKA